MPRPATITWEDPATASYRACQLCDHRHPDGRLCFHPEALRDGNTVTIVAARASGGFCGPDAKHLTFPGLQPLQSFTRAAA